MYIISLKLNINQIGQYYTLNPKYAANFRFIEDHLNLSNIIVLK